jgi:hypothetical protein
MVCILLAGVFAVRRLRGLCIAPPICTSSTELDCCLFPRIYLIHLVGINTGCFWIIDALMRHVWLMQLPTVSSMASRACGSHGQCYSRKVVQVMQRYCFIRKPRGVDLLDSLASHALGLPTVKRVCKCLAQSTCCLASRFYPLMFVEYLRACAHGSMGVSQDTTAVVGCVASSSSALN